MEKKLEVKHEKIIRERNKDSVSELLEIIIYSFNTFLKGEIEKDDFFSFFDSIFQDKKLTAILRMFSYTFSDLSKVVKFRNLSEEKLRKHVKERFLPEAKDCLTEVTEHGDYEWHIGYIPLLLNERSEQEFRRLLKRLKKEITNFIDQKIDDNGLSNVFISLFVTDDNFVKILRTFEPKIEELTEGIDISDPSWSRKRKEELAKKLVKKIEDILIS